MKSYGLLKEEMQLELRNNLRYWSSNTIDDEYGGFVGRITHEGHVVPKASKGIILNSRILWSFAAASNHLKTNEYHSICKRAFFYLKNNFQDEKNGGVFWELDYLGNPINKRKQVYAQAFSIYALSEYYVFSNDEEARKWAIDLFHLVEEKAHDKKGLGYIEAFQENWESIEDMRLSDKDMNAAKTMNTHLHLLEAYSSLLKVYNSDLLRRSLRELVDLFLNKFLNGQNHYELFFDEHWKLLSSAVSYGHDIETAWLLIEAGRLLDDKDLMKTIELKAIAVADRFLDVGIDSVGAVMNEKSGSGVVDADRHWWPQVEAIVGLNYVYELTQNIKYRHASLRIWDFTKEYLIDREHGEWYFRVDSNGVPYKDEDKVSMWKAPYHTSRACILINS